MKKYPISKKIKVAIVGGGNASAITALVLNKDKTFDVTIYHDFSQETIGVGESTDLGIPRTLICSLGWDYTKIDDLKATIKYAVQKKGWGCYGREYLSAFYPYGIKMGLHIKSEDFVKYAYSQLKFPIIDKKIEDLSTLFLDFDYIFDCRGFQLNNIKKEWEVPYKILNSCIWYQDNTTNNSMFTGTTVTDNGWLWEIPLPRGDSYGYLYNSSITTKEDALKDLAKLVNIKTDKIKHINFKSYIRENIYDGRIIYNGNNALFVEPLEATSLSTYIEVADAAIDYMRGFPVEESEKRVKALYNCNMNFILLHYLENPRNSPFWMYAKEIANSYINSLPKEDPLFGVIYEVLESKRIIDLTDSYVESVDRGYGNFPNELLMINLIGLGLDKKFSLRN